MPLALGALLAAVSMWLCSLGSGFSPISLEEKGTRKSSSVWPPECLSPRLFLSSHSGRDISTVRLKDRTHSTHRLQISPILFEGMSAWARSERLFPEKTAVMRLRVGISVITKRLLRPGWAGGIGHWSSAVLRVEGSEGTPRPLLFS